MRILITLVTFLTLNVHAQKNSIPNTDESWVSVEGKVTDATGDYFRLNTGKNSIIVEMDDWDWYKEGYKILEGDNVTVIGKVDNDLFEKKKIEASSVYVKGLNTYYYANAADEEGGIAVAVPGTAASVQITGQVSQIDGREFIINKDGSKFKVDTSAMGYNPLDKEGFQKIKIGDRVRVYGNMDYDLFEKREIMANTVITMHKDLGRSRI